MDHTAHPCGCKKDIGMSRAHVPQSCEEHGNLFVYDHGLGVASPASNHAGRRLSSSSLNPGKGFGASKVQRQKVKGLVCVGCGREATEDGSVVIDPAHVWPKSKGGCDKAVCVIPLCRLVFDGSGCHQLFDDGKLDLLERLEERDRHEAYAEEIAHPIAAHGVPLVALVRRLTGSAWEFRRVDEVAVVAE